MYIPAHDPIPGEPDTPADNPADAETGAGATGSGASSSGTSVPEPRTESAAAGESGSARSLAALWAARAGVAERAVRSRHLRNLLLLPGTRLGRAHWPSTVADECHLPFNYWWQAHLLDCLVDADLRAPNPGRRVEVARILRGLWLRNGLRWPNRYYDDMAWLGLALQRIRREWGVHGSAIDTLVRQLLGAWTDDAGGGIWWRKQDDYKNVPANGPAAILLARQGGSANLRRAVSTVEWMERHLVDPDTGLVWDGLRPGTERASVGEVDRRIFTYCQGVLLGACVELALATGEVRWLARAERTVEAVAEHLAADGVVSGSGGGDGGLFGGILVRYLADAARRLPDGLTSADRTRELAASLVTASATAAWRNRATAASGPLFGPDWTVPALVPPRSGGTLPERDLSVQLSGWMVMEAAAALERAPA